MRISTTELAASLYRPAQQGLKPSSKAEYKANRVRKLSAKGYSVDQIMWICYSVETEEMLQALEKDHRERKLDPHAGNHLTPYEIVLGKRARFKKLIEGILNA